MPPSDSAAPPTSVLRNRRFRRIWGAGFFTSMMRWLDLLVLGVFSFDLTDSPGLVAIALLVRMLPRFLFGVFLGALADRVNRKYLWITALLTLSVLSLVLGALIAADAIVYWHLLIVVFIAGIFWATEFPVRRAMIGDVVPNEAIGRAFGIDWTTDSFNRMIGPALGGGLIVTFGAEGAYFLMAGAFVIAALIASTLPYRRHRREGAPQSPIQDVREGLRLVRASELLVSVLLVTVIFNLVFSPYQSMIPVIGKDILDANPLRVGLLSATEGFGAVLGAVWIASRAQPRHYPRLYYFGTAAFFVCALAFSQSNAYALSMACLFLAGFGFSAFATMQTTILVRATDVAMRGRVLGALSLAIGAGPLGALQVGPLVAGVGVQATLSLLVIEGMVLLVLVGIVWPVLRRPWTGGESDVLPEPATP